MVGEREREKERWRRSVLQHLLGKNKRGKESFTTNSLASF